MGHPVFCIFMGHPVFCIFMGHPVFCIFMGHPVFCIFMGHPVFCIFSAKKFPIFDSFYNNIMLRSQVQLNAIFWKICC